MANIKSQKKRILTNAKAAERNKAVKSELKTRSKNAVSAIGSDTADESMRLAVKRLDMAAAKGVIHKNQAARRKSRLMKKINTVSERRGLVGKSRESVHRRLVPAADPSARAATTARRATITSITSSSGHSLAPRRSDRLAQLDGLTTHFASCELIKAFLAGNRLEPALLPDDSSLALAPSRVALGYGCAGCITCKGSVAAASFVAAQSDLVVSPRSTASMRSPGGTPPASPGRAT